MAAQQRGRAAGSENDGARNERNNRRDDRRGDRRTDRRAEDRNAYVERVVTINRVAKTVKGGRRMSFTALVVVGDGNGTVGVGYGKAKEVPAAIAKGTEEAKKNFFKVPRIGTTIPHLVQVRTPQASSCSVQLRLVPVLSPVAQFVQSWSALVSTMFFLSPSVLPTLSILFAVRSQH